MLDTAVSMHAILRTSRHVLCLGICTSWPSHFCKPSKSHTNLAELAKCAGMVAGLFEKKSGHRVNGCFHVNIDVIKMYTFSIWKKSIPVNRLLTRVYKKPIPVNARVSVLESGV